MEFSRKNDRTVFRPAPRQSPRRPFTAEALASVLSAELRLTPDTPLYIAYSGGLDSHVLLHALARGRQTIPWRLTALHIDHGLQAVSPDWARHCADVCAALRVPLRIEC